MIVRRIVVLLDHLSPQQGAFAHALEWAWHLRLPIHAWATPTVVQASNSPIQIEDVDQVAAARFTAPSISDEFATRVNVCAKACADWGVKLRLTPLEGYSSPWLRQHLQPDDLLMVSYAPAGTERAALIGQVLRHRAALLICPEAWKNTLSRMLVLYRSREHSQEALTTALDLCRYVRATPVVLTVARSQREGDRLQQPARAAFAQRSQAGNCDLLIGVDVAEAAARVARWRQCRLLVMGRYGRPHWARWFGGSTTERLIGLADSLAILTLPRRETSAVYPDRSDSLPARGEIFDSSGSGETPQQKVGGT